MVQPAEPSLLRKLLPWVLVISAKVYIVWALVNLILTFNGEELSKRMEICLDALGSGC